MQDNDTHPLGFTAVPSLGLCPPRQQSESFYCPATPRGDLKQGASAREAGQHFLYAPDADHCRQT